MKADKFSGGQIAATLTKYSEQQKTHERVTIDTADANKAKRLTGLRCLLFHFLFTSKFNTNEKRGIYTPNKTRSGAHTKGEHSLLRY